MSQHVDWWVIAPVLGLALAGIVALLGDALLPRTRSWLPTAATLGGVLMALGFALAVPTPRGTFCLDAGSGSVGCSLRVDHVTQVWWVVLLVGVGLVVALVQPQAAAGELPAGELHLLLMASAAGALVLAAAGDLITLLVAMETVSLPVFALVGLRADRRGAEAAMKLFLVSVIATAFSLLGISMVYGATGSVVAAPIAAAAEGGSAVAPVVGAGMALTLVALAFKVAVVPFQAWVPDTYVGAPVPVAAYLSVVSKVAGLAGLVIVLVHMFPSYEDTWRPLVAVAAAVTMTIGNLAALRQSHLVRLLAWSSVAQAGYLIVPLAAGGGPRDLGAMQTYAAMYVVANLAAFAAASAAAWHGIVTVGELAGVARRQPLLAASLGFAVLCLAGLPPGVIGLVAKVVVFQSAVDGGLGWLAVVLAINVAIGLVYYLRVLAAMFRSGPETGGPPWRVSLSVQVVLGGTLAASVALSALPGLLLSAVYP